MWRALPSIPQLVFVGAGFHPRSSASCSMLPIIVVLVIIETTSQLYTVPIMGSKHRHISYLTWLSSIWERYRKDGMVGYTLQTRNLQRKGIYCDSQDNRLDPKISTQIIQRFDYFFNGILGKWNWNENVFWNVAPLSHETKIKALNP